MEPRVVQPAVDVRAPIELEKPEPAAEHQAPRAAPVASDATALPVPPTMPYPCPFHAHALVYSQSDQASHGRSCACTIDARVTNEFSGTCTHRSRNRCCRRDPWTINNMSEANAAQEASAKTAKPARNMFRPNQANVEQPSPAERPPQRPRRADGKSNAPAQVVQPSSPAPRRSRCLCQLPSPATRLKHPQRVAWQALACPRNGCLIASNSARLDGERGPWVHVFRLSRDESRL